MSLCERPSTTLGTSDLLPGYDGGDAIQFIGIVEVDALAVAAHRLVQILRQRDRRVPRPAHGRDLRHRIGEQVRVRQPLVRELVDEAGIRAILQQPPHQVSEQVAMSADRRVDAGVIALLADQALVEALAHAVEALELEVAAAARPFEQSGYGQRIVGREGREDMLRLQHVVRAGEIGDVGRRLAGEEGVIGKPLLLRPLDLAVPIGALDQPDGETPPRLRAQSVDPGEDRPAPLAVGLDGHAEPVPAPERGEGRDPLDDIEAHFEPLALLGIDGETDALVLGEQRQRLDLPEQRRHATLILRHLVARVERRQLDRNRMSARRHLADRADRPLVGAEIALGVREGARRLAEHVEACREAGILFLVHAPDGFVDGPAHDEYLAHQLHRSAHRLADERLARAGNQALQGTRLLAAADQSPADQQPPGRRVNQRGMRLAAMRLPVRIAELIGDQLVGSLRVGHAQERLGQRE